MRRKSRKMRAPRARISYGRSSSRRHTTSWNEPVRPAGRELQNLPKEALTCRSRADSTALARKSRRVATHNLYPFMTLAHVAYDTLARSRPDFASEPIFKPLVISMAYALDGILTPREGKARMKDAMQKGAVIRTRRVLRAVSRAWPVRVR